MRSEEVDSFGWSLSFNILVGLDRLCDVTAVEPLAVLRSDGISCTEPFSVGPCTVFAALYQGAESGDATVLFLLCFVARHGISQHWAVVEGIVKSLSSSVIGHDISCVMCPVAPPRASDSHCFSTWMTRGALKRWIGSSGPLALGFFQVVLFASGGISAGPLLNLQYHQALCINEPPFGPSLVSRVSLGFSFRARNTCIGRSGTWAGYCSRYDTAIFVADESAPVTWSNDFLLTLLLTIASVLVPLVRGALFLVFLALIRAFSMRLPGRSTPLGRLLFWGGQGAPCIVLCAFGLIQGRSDAISGSRPPRHRTRNVTCSKGHFSGHVSVFGRFLRAWVCILQLPVLVRGASEGATFLRELSEAYSVFQPDELPSTPTREVVGLAAPTAYSSEDSRNVPIQVSVAMMQSQENLQAYGEVLELPSLRIWMLIPGRKDVIVQLPSVEGGVDGIVLALDRWAQDRFQQRCHVELLQHQAVEGVIAATVVPQWVEPSHQAVVLVDLTDIGGPLFAELKFSQMYRSELDACVRAYTDGPCDVYTQHGVEPWASAVPYKVRNAEVIKVVRKGLEPRWRQLPRDNLWGLWTRYEPVLPSLPPWPGWLVAQDCGSRLVLCPHDSLPEIRAAIAAKMGCSETQLCVFHDSACTLARDLLFQGRGVKGIVAVQHQDPDTLITPTSSTFVFVDAAAVGKGIFAISAWHAEQDDTLPLRCVGPYLAAGYRAILGEVQDSDTAVSAGIPKPADLSFGAFCT